MNTIHDDEFRPIAATRDGTTLIALIAHGDDTPRAVRFEPDTDTTPAYIGCDCGVTLKLPAPSDQLCLHMRAFNTLVGADFDNGSST